MHKATSTRDISTERTLLVVLFTIFHLHSSASLFTVACSRCRLDWELLLAYSTQRWRSPSWKKQKGRTRHIASEMLRTRRSTLERYLMRCDRETHHKAVLQSFEMRRMSHLRDQAKGNSVWTMVLSHHETRRMVDGQNTKEVLSVLEGKSQQEWADAFVAQMNQLAFGKSQYRSYDNSKPPKQIGTVV